MLGLYVPRSTAVCAASPTDQQLSVLRCQDLSASCSGRASLEYRRGDSHSVPHLGRLNLQARAVSQRLSLRCRRSVVLVRAAAGDASAEAGTRAADEALSEGVQLPTHMNNIPHARSTRQFFYQDATAAVQSAIQSGASRIQLRCTIPELNPAMDVYRIGSLLEMVREMADALAQDGDHVKVCVQQSMGQGVFQGLPLSLSGVRRIMEAMDWGDIVDFVHFGQVGANQVDESRYYILIAPQNVVGTTIMTNLIEMVIAAEQSGKTVVLVNPVLKDIPSANAVMGIRGRAERVAMANSFEVAYHFRLLYMSSAMMYPIMGALRHTHGGPWEVYKRIQLGKREEEYRLVATFDEEPVGRSMTKLFIK